MNIARCLDTVHLDGWLGDGAANELASCAPRRLGEAGETLAARWLEAQGWRVLERNWHSRFGELDAIAVDTHGRLVFVEVKSRRGTRYGTPQEAVTRDKQAHLRAAAWLWMQQRRGSLGTRGVRFDVVTVFVQGADARIEHIPGAF